ncbi:MAG TPA: sugar phosphate nucleotidyltransferase [Candidatus Sulfotelmatobacter sp.]|nr:sugar phosphate nucleotidyltransferase [Candidatus Sulfotelmatobacter sp.]
MKSALAVILAGGEGERLSLLSSERAKPAVPFGGKYRIIDFALSNCINSGITDVMVLTQYNPRSLNDHIGLGRAWDLDRNSGGIRLMQPYIARGRGNMDWYRGTADAVLRNLTSVMESPADVVLVLAGDHIYKMDYDPFIRAHRRHRADVTIAVRPVPLGDAHRFGILALDDSDAVVEWQEKPEHPRSDLASMGIYVFTKRALVEWLSESRVDFGRHVIPAMLEARARVFGYAFDGYWQDVGTVESYWQANMDLLAERPELDLDDRAWVIHTRSEERPPARIGPTAAVHRSMISHGCVINGTVERSVLGPGVHVGIGAVVRDSIVFLDTDIRAGAVVDRAIIDKNVTIYPNAVVGQGDDMDVVNRQEPTRLTTGITLVGKRAVVPRGVRLGRNCKVAENARATDFRSRVVRSGSSVEAHRGAVQVAPAGARRSGRPAVV